MNKDESVTDVLFGAVLLAFFAGGLLLNFAIKGTVCTTLPGQVACYYAASPQGHPSR